MQELNETQQQNCVGLTVQREARCTNDLLYETAMQKFKRLYMCEFKPDQREIDLDERLNDYYTNTADCDNRAAGIHWRKFALWCSRMRYTHLDISAAKKRVLSRYDI